VLLFLNHAEALRTRQHAPSGFEINVKRPAFAGFLDRLPQVVNMLDQKVIGVSFQQVYGKDVPDSVQVSATL
jgi:hypothetical protein